MERLSMCRICLLKSVRLYVVANKNLQEIYEKLTDIPLKNEDNIPFATCSFCYIKLDQCYRLQRKCLDAEKLFMQMLNEEYQHNQDQVELYGGFVVTPVENISMGGDSGIETDAIKQEPICQEPYAELKVERLNDDLKSENFNIGYPDQEDPAVYSEADSDDNLPLINIRDGLQEEQEAGIGTESAPVLKELKLEFINVKREVSIPVQREDDIPAKQKKNEQSEEKNILKSTQFAEFIPVANPYINNYDKDRRNKQNIEELTNNLSRNESQLKIWKTIVETEKSGVEMRYICDYCSRGFKTKKYLRRHIFIHTGNQPYKCDICIKGFTRKYYLVSHMRLHTGEKPYKCDICQRSFAYQSNFRYHCRRHTEIPEKRFECEVCKKMFSYKNHLLIHYRLHTGEKPYKCGVCERSFVSKSHLNQHKKTHTSIRPFKCDICQKDFIYKGQLNLHSWSHTAAERPHKCHMCERSFVAKSTLKIHIRTHTGEKPYRCDFCFRDFNRVNYLNKHVCKARPLPENSGQCFTIKCDICQKSFSKIKDLIYHYSSEHPEEKPYKCNACSRCYGSKGGLNKHIRIAHK